MLSRREFAVLQLVASSLGLTIAVGGGFLVDHFVAASVRWLLESFAVGLALTVSQLFAGGHNSYRKYVAALGGPSNPPPAFWATTGQAIVAVGALLFLIVVTLFAAHAGDGSWVRTLTAFAWPGTIGALLVYLLIARDWREELASRRLPNDR